MSEKARPHVLYAEDDEQLRLQLSQLLSKYGFDITTVANDDQAITVIDSGVRIDALITDNAFDIGRRDAQAAKRIIEHLEAKAIHVPTISFGNDFMKYLGVQVTYDLLKGDFAGLKQSLGIIKTSWSLMD